MATMAVTPSTVMVTGNTGIDALQWAASLEVPWTDPRLAALEDGRQIIVVTAHRRENWGLGIAGIVEGVARIAHARPDVTIVVPMHPNPIVRTPIEAGLSGFDNILLTDAIDYVEFARLLKMATIAITAATAITNMTGPTCSLNQSPRPPLPLELLPVEPVVGAVGVSVMQV